MFKTMVHQTIAIYGLMFLLGALLGAPLVSHSYASSGGAVLAKPALARSIALRPSAENDTLTEETWVDCIPVNVATFPARVHVKCAAAVGGIQYFAVATADPS